MLQCVCSRYFLFFSPRESHAGWLRTDVAGSPAWTGPVSPMSGLSSDGMNQASHSGKRSAGEAEGLFTAGLHRFCAGSRFTVKRGFGPVCEVRV